MTARTSIRTTFKVWLKDNLATALSVERIPVDSGWPGKRLEDNHVWLDRVTGIVSTPFEMAGRKNRDDNFTVRVIFQASGEGLSIEDCDQKAEEMYAALEDLLAEDPGIDLMPGIIDAQLDNVEGPSGEFTDEGAVSFVMADVAVQSRLF